MNTGIAPNLGKKERDAFVSVTDTGLWDILLASFTTPFAVAPLLTGLLGDFWSAAVFIPFWIAVYIFVSVARKNVVIPRVGEVRWSASRRKKLKTTGRAMLAVNTVVFAIGVGRRSGRSAGSVLAAVALSTAHRAVSGYNAHAGSQRLPGNGPSRIRMDP